MDSQRVLRCSEHAAVASQDLALGVALGIGDVNAQHETVELRLRQWKCALELAWVLRRQYQEIRRQLPRSALHAYLAFLHGFEQCRLRLWPGAIDLVNQHDIGEQRSGPKHETARCLIEHVYTDDIARHQIRRSLNALELPAKRAGQCLGQQGLAKPRHALHQHMTARHQRDDQCIHGRTGANHHASEFTREQVMQPADWSAHAAMCLSVARMRLCSRTSGTR